MLFNSYEFIILFLPITFALYFIFNRLGWNLAARTWLVMASLFFYSWWNIVYLPLILASIAFNYLLGSALSRGRDESGAKWLLISGIVANLALLGYYKYADFFISNLNLLLGARYELLRVVLPLGISFFTFTQIAYLVDAHRGQAREYSAVNYALFVTFFPHLLAGPILHHKEMMPQFEDPERRGLNYEMIARGLFLFFVGLFKKVIIADNFAVWANLGFDQLATLTLVEAWMTSLSYTMQLYFDFSAYTDMAIGAAMLFNIELPINFFSPYKSTSIQEFWRRWHMTLGRFFRDYIYIPLGGNRAGEQRTYVNLLTTFLLVGLWHGAGWNFVFWGFMHGAALLVHRFWQRFRIKMPAWLAWFMTFNYVNLGWVFFRASSWGDALKVIKGMLGMSGVILPRSLYGLMPGLQNYGIRFDALPWNTDARLIIAAIAAGILVCVATPNSIEMKDRFKGSLVSAILTAAMALAGLLSLTKITEFLYFNF